MTLSKVLVHVIVLARLRCKQGYCIVVMFNQIVMALSPTWGAHICWYTWHHR